MPAGRLDLDVFFGRLEQGDSHGAPSAGFRERVAVLKNHYAGAVVLVEKVGQRYRRYEVARDDIVDALAAAVTARQALGGYQTLPEKVELDQFGLRMEMVYATVVPPYPNSISHP